MPRRTLGSIARKSTVYKRPSWSTFDFVMSVSGEWRRLSGVLPKPPQPTFSAAPRRADADARSTPAAATTTTAASARESARHLIEVSIVLLPARDRRGPLAARAGRRRARGADAGG